MADVNSFKYALKELYRKKKPKKFVKGLKKHNIGASKKGGY